MAHKFIDLQQQVSLNKKISDEALGLSDDSRDLRHQLIDEMNMYQEQNEAMMENKHIQFKQEFKKLENRCIRTEDNYKDWKKIQEENASTIKVMRVQ